MPTPHHQLLGTYTTPRFNFGDRVQCAVRGLVEIVGLKEAPIPWPIGKPVDGSSRARGLVIYRGLEKALCREASETVAHCWGVTPQTVWAWRKAIGLTGRITEGSTVLRRAAAQQPAVLEGLRRAHARANDPDRRARIAASRKGKKRPPHVIEAVRQAHLGTQHSDEARARMSRSQRARGAWPPAAGRPWTADEDNLLAGDLPDEEVASRTRRTVGAVRCRRRKHQRAGQPCTP